MFRFFLYSTLLMTLIVGAIVVTPFYYYGIYKADDSQIIGSYLDWKSYEPFSGFYAPIVNPIAKYGCVLLSFLLIGNLLLTFLVIKKTDLVNRKRVLIISLIVFIIVAIPYVIHIGGIIGWYLD